MNRWTPWIDHEVKARLMSEWEGVMIRRAAINCRNFPVISCRGAVPPEPPTMKIDGGGTTLDFDSLLGHKEEGQELIQL